MIPSIELKKGNWVNDAGGNALRITTVEEIKACGGYEGIKVTPEVAAMFLDSIGCNDLHQLQNLHMQITGKEFNPYK